MFKKHTLPTSAGIAFALVLLANTTARADLLSWGYNWTPSTMQVNANGGGSGYLSLTDEPVNSATGSSNTVITDIHAFSSAPYNTPDIYNKVPVSFTLQLEDKSNQAKGSVSFSGYFSGTTTGSNSNVYFTATSPTTESVSLGGNTYSVSLGHYTPPGPPGQSNAGSMNAFVTVTAGGGNGGIASVPEPSASMLAGMALPWLGLSGWRLRKKRK